MAKLWRGCCSALLLVLLFMSGTVTVAAEARGLPATAFSFTFEEAENAQGSKEEDLPPVTGDHGRTGWILLMAASGTGLIMAANARKKYN